MRPVLCHARLCRVRESHLPTCRELDCSGCFPRDAAPGLNLCWPHHDQLARNAVRAGEVYGELLLQLESAGGGYGPPVSGTRDVGLDLNPRAVAARDRIAEVLALWSKLIVDERGHQPPTSSPIVMAEFLARNVSWLAAHPLAGECFDELRELAYGEPYRVAYPSGTRVRVIGTCPAEGCSAELRVLMRAPNSPLSSEAICAGEVPHRWPPHRYLALLDLLAVA